MKQILKFLLLALLIALLFYLIGPDGNREVQIREITVTNYFFMPPQ